MSSPEENIRELFEQLSQGPASGRASVTMRSLADHLQVDLNPTNPRAARIRAIIPRDASRGVTLAIGKGTIFEIPENGGRYTENHSAVDEAKSISKAVLAGRFREKVRTDRENRIVSSKGTVDIPPPITARWRRLLVNPFRRTSVEFLEYEPY